MDRRQQRYKKEWECEKDGNGYLIGEWCQEHKTKEHYGYCLVCKNDIYVGNTGKQSLILHGTRQKHIVSFKTSKAQPSIHWFSKSPPIDESVLEAELRWSAFTAEHDLSANLCESVSNLFHAMFPDSKIAKKFQCGRTKSSYLTTDGLAKTFHEELVKHLQSQKFAVLIDESNKKHGSKYLHILVRYNNEKLGKIVTQFYKALVVNTATAENIVSAINSAFHEDTISWSNVLQVMSDSPYVMRGKKGGVITLIKERYAPHLLDIGGCTLHHIHNAVSHATECLGEEVEEFAVDVFSFFKHRTGQCDDFKDVQGMLDLPEHKILRFVGTRWLSILPVTNRLLEQWEALSTFFNALNKKNPNVAKTHRVRRITTYLQDPVIHAKMLFLSAVVPQFEALEKLFQSEDTQIHIMYDELALLLKNTMIQFLKPSAIESVHTADELLKVDHLEFKNQLPDNKLPIGKETENIFRKDMKESERKLFHHSVRQFYTTVITKLKQYLPLDKKLLHDFQCFNPDAQKEMTSLGAVKRVAVALKACDGKVNVDTIDKEWRVYAVEDLSEVKEKSTDSGKIDIKKYWDEVALLRMPSGELKFQHISRLVTLCMSFAHGNSDTERSFSMSSQILTKHRNRVGIDTLNGLMVVKSHLSVTNAKASNFSTAEGVLRNGKIAFQSYTSRLEKAKEKQAAEEKKKQKEIEGEKLRHALKQSAKAEKIKREMLEKEKLLKEKKQEQEMLFDKANKMMKDLQSTLKDVQKKGMEMRVCDKDVVNIKEKLITCSLKRKSVASGSSCTQSKKCKSGMSMSIRDMFQPQRRFDKDQVACGLIPSGYENYTALNCPGNGNCLYNAVSLLIAGDCSMADDLRQKTATELILKSSSYADHEHLKQAALNMKSDVKTVLHTVADIPADCDDIVEVVRIEGERTRIDSTWSSLLQILALATVVGQEIESVFPEGEHYAKSLLSGVLKPIRVLDSGSRFKQSPKRLVVMWSRVNPKNDGGVFVPDHIVPLVEK